MKFFAIVFAVLMVLACRQTGITGTWVGQMFDGYDDAMPSSGVPEPVFTLTFNDDGTFTGRIENHIMMEQRGKIRGTYKLDGDKLTLTGTNEMYIDDGYKKDTSTIPFATVLIVGKDRLTVAGQEKETMKMVFRREGSPRLKPPSKPKEKLSSSVALDIFKKLKTNYAAYRTYADDGMFKSTGKAFRAKDAVFHTRFNRDGRFLFRVEHMANGKSYQTDIVYGDGKKYWVGGMIDHSGFTERPLGNGLSLLTIDVDSTATLIPSLLWPEKMNGADIDRWKSLNLVGVQKVSGRDCYVIEGNEGDLGKMILWVDKSSLLIRHLYSSFMNCNTEYRPRVNIAIPAKDFRDTKFE